MKRALFVAFVLLTYSVSAHAILGEFFNAVGSVFSSIGSVAMVAVAYLIGTPAIAAITFATQVYAAYKANEIKKQQEEQRLAAIESYNASLKDRTVTSVTTEAPYIHVYGRARVGSAIVAIFSSGDKDEYQHLICVHAAHQVEEIEEIYIAGKPLGTLDSYGFVTGGDYYDTTPTTFTLPIFGGITATFPGGVPRVRVIKHLGGASDPADPTLINEVPTKWDANRVLRGFCYTYIRLDLNQQEFQGGIPSIEVLIKGKRVYDPRILANAWSDNVALCLYDYLRDSFCGIPSADIPTADVITAANVCDELITVGTLSNVARYTCNGTVSSDQDQSRIISQFASAMAGGINITTWEMWAGEYTSPVMTIEQEDIVGGLSITPGLSDADIYNGVTGRFISDENDYVATDFQPYQNATYAAADGADLFVSLEYPFTNKTQRIHNLARIFIEDQRNGFTVKGTFSLKCWDVKVGQRIQLNSAFFGFTNKVFRVVGKSYSYSGTVELTLKEDASAIWDLADAVVIDETPNTDLPNPYSIDAPTLLLLESAEDNLLVNSDGTITSRIKASWSTPTNIRASAAEIQMKKSSDSVWQTYINTDAEQLSAWLSPVTDGVSYDVRIRYVNPYFDTASAWLEESNYVVIGKREPPDDVTKFRIDSSTLYWTGVSNVDLAGYEVRFNYGVNTWWESTVPLHSGLLLASPWTLETHPSGQVTLLIKAVDTTGNYSQNAATIITSLGDSIATNLLLEWPQAPTFTGTITNGTIVSSELVADSTDFFYGSDTGPFYGFDTEAFYSLSTYEQMTYSWSISIPSTVYGTDNRLLLQYDLEGDYVIEYARTNTSAFYGSDSDLFYGADTDGFYGEDPVWTSWSGSIDANNAEIIYFRIIFADGPVQGVITVATPQIDVPDITEEVNNQVISSAGTRLSITKTYREIKNVQITLQDDGNDGIGIRILDKNATLGPLVQAFDKDNVAVASLVDAIVKGY